MVSYSNCVLGIATVVTYAVLLIVYKKVTKDMMMPKVSSAGIPQQQQKDQDAQVTKLVMAIVLCSIVLYVLPNIGLYYVIEFAHLLDSGQIGP